MKMLRTKRFTKPENRFQQYLQSQPVFNWFDRYENKKAYDTPVSGDSVHNVSWIAKRVGE